MVNGRRIFRNAKRYELPQCPQITVARIEGPLFFASVENAQEQFHEITALKKGGATVLLGLKGLWKIDLSGIDFLVKEIRRIRRSGGDFRVFTSNPQALTSFRRLNFFDILKEDHLHNNKAEAIAAAVRDADDEICRGCKLRIFLECETKPGAMPKGQDFAKLDQDRSTP